MGNTRQTNTFVKGMQMDLDYSLIDASQYQYAENLRVVANDAGTFGAIQSIEGFLNTPLSQVITGETVIHVNTIRDWAVVFTKINGTDKYNIYRFDFTGGREVNPEVTKVASALTLDIPSNDSISSVCRWESDNLVKVYWCDSAHPIRVINIAVVNEVAAEDLSIIPQGVLPPLFFKGLGSGGLLSGKYQYCYQLFNSRGSETSISVLSPITSVSKYSGKADSQDVLGSSSKDNSGKSIVLETNLNTNAFTRARIISLYYKDNASVPVITVIDDINIVSGKIYYEDKGGSVVNELTIDEFNALVTYPFIPKVLESKDNMLFAANITEDTWDIGDDYDTRAYRCDKSGQVLLTSTSSQSNLVFNISDVDTQVVPIEHDCICPYNSSTTNEYRYMPTSTGEYVLGGKGKNIEYRFIVTDLIEDSSVAPESGRINEDYSLSSKAMVSSHLDLYGVNSSGVKTSIGNIELPSVKSRVLNYSDSEIESLVRSYHRDEIYRFGIVFYNKTNIASSVRWIADIRMPEIQNTGYTTFSTGKQVVLGNTTTDRMQLVTHPMGVQFTVKNIPDEVVAYEIVRCERTISDRTILMQGIVSQVIEHDSSKNMLVPMPYLSYSSRHGLVSVTSKYLYSWNFSKYAATDYFIFVSPEVCINRENAAEVLDKVGYINSLLRLSSPIESKIGTGWLPDRVTHTGGNQKIFATAKGIKANGKDIVDINTLDYNKENGWVHEYILTDLAGAVDNAIRMDGGDFYGTTLAKYYYQEVGGTGGTSTIDEIKMAINTDPFDLTDDKWKTKPTNIGNKTYYNWMYDHKDTDVDLDANNLRKTGPHGVCAVIYSKEMKDHIKLVGSGIEAEPAGMKDANTVVLCNLRQSVVPYGGSSYSARQNSVYIPTGCYQAINSNSTYNNYCFGGDTYVGVLDYANGMFGYRADNYNPENEKNKVYNGAYIPVESSINLSLRGDKVPTSKTYDVATGYSNHFVQNDIIQIGDYYTQTEPLYAYNDAYSAQPRAKKFVSKSIYSIDNLHTDTRVMNSQPKSNNEVSDSWTKFKVANYIDVDSRFGSINNMRLFNNNLFFWQTDAFGTLAINERSLIQDNNIGALTLGTGGILSRYDYITTKNGSKEGHLRTATNSDSTIYWYDYDRNEICGFNGGLQTVSKLKGVQSYLTKDKPNFREPITTYDKKYNEALFTLDDKTLVFNEQIGAFTSFYTYRPDWYAEFTDKLYLFNGLRLFKYNSGDDKNLYTDKDKIAYLRFVVNKDYAQSKTFDNVEYGGDFTHNTNFGNIYFETKRQISETLTNSDIDYREDTYKFCIPRNSIELNAAEELVNKSYKDRMKGKYLVCHYKYDCNNKKKFKVPYISTAYRYSMI